MEAVYGIKKEEHEGQNEDLTQNTEDRHATIHFHQKNDRVAAPTNADDVVSRDDEKIPEMERVIRSDSLALHKDTTLTLTGVNSMLMEKAARVGSNMTSAYSDKQNRLSLNKDHINREKKFNPISTVQRCIWIPIRYPVIKSCSCSC